MTHGLCPCIICCTTTIKIPLQNMQRANISRYHLSWFSQSPLFLDPCTITGAPVFPYSVSFRKSRSERYSPSKPFCVLHQPTLLCKKLSDAYLFSSMRCKYASILTFLFFFVKFFCIFYGLQLPQGAYPSKISCSRVPLYAFLLLSFILDTDEHDGL